jgi:hypothetical protein
MNIGRDGYFVRLPFDQSYTKMLDLSKFYPKRSSVSEMKNIGIWFINKSSDLPCGFHHQEQLFYIWQGDL